MPIKSTRFKCLIDEESKCFILTFFGKAGQRNDPTNMRNITLRTWDQVQATVELARRGRLESNAEAREKLRLGQPPAIRTETIQEYLDRGGVIKRFVTKRKSTPVDSKSWDDLLDEISSDMKKEGTNFISEISDEPDIEWVEELNETELRAKETKAELIGKKEEVVY